MTWRARNSLLSGPPRSTHRHPPLPRRSRALPGHIVVIIFIFQFPVEEELEVLTIGQGLIVL
jgi:hypothetical protein